MGCATWLHSGAARWWALLLCVWVALAPAWHVCEMGGHVMASGAATHGAMTHGLTTHGASSIEAALLASAADNSAVERPLICYCAPRPHSASVSSSVSRFQVAAVPLHHAMTCLAMLLQSMPGDFAAAPSWGGAPGAVVETAWAAPRVRALFAAPRHERGRAPPLTF